ncbi:hypothetical protein FHR32_007016 [Streptosporangium album]|uniref:DUF3618 domain-containing protein n=1 Tax=Streptosporangium album TaxID=47479 RepID=A0A7W7WDR1_9ACTN|nr:DUF3618 domain-containing protein [Streptosporangium album]MBB4942630.1 hypothetical protein [Streptosporangium album]
MTESDPGAPDLESGAAGTTGSRRKEVGEPVAPDERESLNIPPNAPDVAGGTPTADLGVPPSDRDGTPRQVDRTDAGEVVAGAAGGARAGTGGQDGGTTDTKKASRESVRRDIENDRRELGDTVEALVHKTDVKGRVQETATQVGEGIRRAGAATAGTATEMVERVKAAAPEVVGRVKEVTPVDIKDAAEKVRTEAGKRPVAVFAAVAAVAALALVVFRMMRRGRKK